jgi:hypothetical protein
MTTEGFNDVTIPPTTTSSFNQQLQAGMFPDSSPTAFNTYGQPGVGDQPAPIQDASGLPSWATNNQTTWGTPVQNAGAPSLDAGNNLPSFGISKSDSLTPGIDPGQTADALFNPNAVGAQSQFTGSIADPVDPQNQFASATGGVPSPAPAPNVNIASGGFNSIDAAAPPASAPAAPAPDPSPSPGTPPDITTPVGPDIAPSTNPDVLSALNDPGIGNPAGDGAGNTGDGGGPGGGNGGGGNLLASQLVEPIPGNSPELVLSAPDAPADGASPDTNPFFPTITLGDEGSPLGNFNPELGLFASRARPGGAAPIDNTAAFDALNNA